MLCQVADPQLQGRKPSNPALLSWHYGPGVKGGLSSPVPHRLDLLLRCRGETGGPAPRGRVG